MFLLLIITIKITDTCPTGCTLNASTVCVQNNCVCAMGMVNDGVCRRGKIQQQKMHWCVHVCEKLI